MFLWFWWCEPISVAAPVGRQEAPARDPAKWGAPVLAAEGPVGLLPPGTGLYKENLPNFNFIFWAEYSRPSGWGGFIFWRCKLYAKFLVVCFLFPKSATYHIHPNFFPEWHHRRVLWNLTYACRHVLGSGSGFVKWLLMYSQSKKSGGISYHTRMINLFDYIFISSTITMFVNRCSYMPPSHFFCNGRDDAKGVFYLFRYSGRFAKLCIRWGSISLYQSE